MSRRTSIVKALAEKLKSIGPPVQKPESICQQDLYGVSLIYP